MATIAPYVVGLMASLAGIFGTYGMLRGKKVDAGEWLTGELRKDAMAARADAKDARDSVKTLEHRIDVLEAQLEVALHRTVDVTTVTTTSTSG